MYGKPKGPVPADGRPAPTMREIRESDRRTTEARARLEAAINAALAESAAKDRARAEHEHPSAANLQTTDARVISLYKRQRARLLDAPRSSSTDEALAALGDVWAEA